MLSVKYRPGSAYEAPDERSALKSIKPRRNSITFNDISKANTIDNRSTKRRSSHDRTGFIHKEEDFGTFFRSPHDRNSVLSSKISGQTISDGVPRLNTLNIRKLSVQTFYYKKSAVHSLNNSS